MIEKAHTRITLALDIVKKLDNGYHELNVIKHELEMHDVLEFEENDTIELQSYSNIPLDEHNLVYQVAILLKEKYNIKDGVLINIKKNIPVGGGLAGGSTDAAAALKALNKFWNINASEEELIKLARQLGMDVPFFFYGGTCFDTEATFHIEKLNDMKKYFLIVNPGIQVLTKDAYSNLDYDLVGKKMSALEFKRGNQILHNDFEYSVFKKYPEIRKIKEMFTNRGIPALMSGSGSTIFAMFDKEEEAKEFQEKLRWKSWVTRSR